MGIEGKSLMTKLKPCPFCGWSAILTDYDPYDGRMGNLTIYQVSCQVCGAKIEHRMKEIAVKSWNTRAIDDEGVRGK